MKIEKDFGRKMKEACIKAAEAMELLRVLLSQLDVKKYPHRNKHYNHYNLTLWNQKSIYQRKQRRYSRG